MVQRRSSSLEVLQWCDQHRKSNEESNIEALYIHLDQVCSYTFPALAIYREVDHGRVKLVVDKLKRPRQGRLAVPWPA